MIQNNMSSIFAGKVLGVDKPDPDQEYEEQRQRAMAEDELLRATQPINFNDKIMGGQQAARFLDGKLPELGGTYGYTQRVNMLTGKGANKMEEELNMENKLNSLFGSSGDATNKVNAMLGGTSGSAGDKINSILSGKKSPKTKKINVDSYLTMPKSNKTSDVVSRVLNSSSKQSVRELTKKADALFKTPTTKKIKFDDMMGFGKRAFSGLSAQNNIATSFGLAVTKTANSARKGKNIALDKINSAFSPLKPLPGANIRNGQIFNMFGNPERDARKRMKQQKGLSMFGDFDGDRVVNMFDCNPLDSKKQGRIHDFLTKVKSKVTGTVAGNKIVDIPSDNIQRNSGLDDWNPGVPKTTTYNNIGNTSNDNSNFVYVDEQPEKIIPMVPDTAEAQFKMGNFSDDGTKHFTQNNQYNYNVADLDKDGDVDAEDKRLFENFGIDSQIKFAKRGINKSRNSKEQANYASLLSELNKTTRVMSRVEFDKEKWKYDIAEKEKNKNRTMFEDKIKAASGMMETLIGRTNKVDFRDKIGIVGGNFENNAAALIGSTRGNFQNMAILSGGMTQSPPFQNKVGDIVGNQTQNKSFAQKINETISNKSPEEVMKADVEQQKQIQAAPIIPQVQQFQQQQFQQQQFQQPIRQQQIYPWQPTYARQSTYAQPQQHGYGEPNWSNLTPQEVARYDPQYAKYIAETAGDNKYRRGPYRKRQY